MKNGYSRSEVQRIHVEIKTNAEANAFMVKRPSVLLTYTTKSRK